MFDLPPVQEDTITSTMVARLKICILELSIIWLRPNHIMFKLCPNPIMVRFINDVIP